MRHHNDLTYRLLPRERNVDEVLFAHRTPIRAFALADPNAGYPRDTMIDLERQGVIGRYADEALSIVGSISMFEELATDLAAQLVNECRRLRVTSGSAM